jgi:hypothetical protein
MANFQQLVFLHVQYPEEIFVAVFALKKTKTIYALKKIKIKFMLRVPFPVLDGWFSF